MRGLAYAIPPSIVLWIIIWSVAQAGPYIGLGVGKNSTTSPWIGSESTACMFEAGYTWGNKLEFTLAVTHYSQCTRGDYFDNRDEDSLNNAGFWGRYYF